MDTSLSIDLATSRSVFDACSGGTISTYELQRPCIATVI